MIIWSKKFLLPLILPALIITIFQFSYLSESNASAVRACSLWNTEDEFCHDFSSNDVIENPNYKSATKPLSEDLTETETKSTAEDTVVVISKNCSNNRPYEVNLNGEAVCLSNYSMGRYEQCKSAGLLNQIQFNRNSGEHTINCGLGAKKDLVTGNDGDTNKSSDSQSDSASNSDNQSGLTPIQQVYQRVCGSPEPLDPNCKNAVNKAYTCKQQGQDESCYSRALEYCGTEKSCKNSLITEYSIIRDGIRTLESNLSGVISSQIADEKIKQCSGLKNTANNCCSNPTSCLGGDGQAGSVALGLGMNLMTNLSMAGAKDYQESINKMCNLRKTTSTASAGINAAAAAMCGTQKSTCENECGLIKSEIQVSLDAVEEYCNDDLTGFINASDDVKETCKLKRKLTREVSNANGYETSCNALSDKQFSLGAQAALSMTNALMTTCGGITANSSSFPEGENDGGAFNGDCSNPAFFDNPICTMCRENPKDPQCAGIIGFTGPSDYDDATTSSYKVNPSDFGNTLGLDGMDNDHDGILDPLANPLAENNGLATTANSGGGSGPGRGGSQIRAFGSQGSGGRGPSGKSLNTNILKGTRGGGGYSSKVGFQSGGGFAGYIKASKTNKRKSFDLKAYLPGGEKYAKRGLAGVTKATSSKEIHSAHRNIFVIHSDRFKSVCKKYLYDCK